MKTAPAVETAHSTCNHCSSTIPLSGHRCLCDDITDTMEDLKAVADRTGQHKELLASLRVTLAALQAA